MPDEELRLGTESDEDRRARAPWRMLLYRISQEDHPTPDELADMVVRALEGYGAAEEVRDYISRRIRGEVKLPRGRPGLSRIERAGNASVLEYLVLRLQAAFRIQGVTRPAPRERAIAIVAKSWNWSPSTLKTYLKKDRLGPRFPISEMEARVREYVADGSVRLDPERGIIPVAPEE